MLAVVFGPLFEKWKTGTRLRNNMIANCLEAVLRVFQHHTLSLHSKSVAYRITVSDRLRIFGNFMEDTKLLFILWKRPVTINQPPEDRRLERCCAFSETWCLLSSDIEYATRNFIGFSSTTDSRHTKDCLPLKYPHYHHLKMKCGLHIPWCISGTITSLSITQQILAKCFCT